MIQIVPPTNATQAQLDLFRVIGGVIAELDRVGNPPPYELFYVTGCNLWLEINRTPNPVHRFFVQGPQKDCVDMPPQSAVLHDLTVSVLAVAGQFSSCRMTDEQIAAYIAAVGTYDAATRSRSSAGLQYYRNLPVEVLQG